MVIWVIDSLPTLLPQHTLVEQLGATIQDMLGRSCSGLPELARDSRPARPMLDMLGLRSYAAFAKGAKSDQRLPGRPRYRHHPGPQRRQPGRVHSNSGSKAHIERRRVGGTAGRRSHRRIRAGNLTMAARL
jgi:hypothetical protein